MKIGEIKIPQYTVELRDVELNIEELKELSKMLQEVVNLQRGMKHPTLYRAVPKEPSTV